MRTLSLLLACSLFLIKNNPSQTPPQPYITILYNGVATAQPHQTFIVINEMKYETKYNWLKEHDMGAEVIKSFSKENIERTWHHVFQTIIVNEACFNAIEKFIQENTKYFINPNAVGNFSRVISVEGKEYKVDYDRNRWLFADLVHYLITIQCDSGAIKEMKWYIDNGD